MLAENLSALFQRDLESGFDFELHLVKELPKVAKFCPFILN